MAITQDPHGVGEPVARLEMIIKSRDKCWLASGPKIGQKLAARKHFALDTIASLQRSKYVQLPA